MCVCVCVCVYGALNDFNSRYLIKIKGYTMCTVAAPSYTTIYIKLFENTSNLKLRMTASFKYRTYSAHVHRKRISLPTSK